MSRIPSPKSPDGAHRSTQASPQTLRGALRTMLRTLRPMGRTVHTASMQVVHTLAHSTGTRVPSAWGMLLRSALPLWLATRLLAFVVTYLSWTMLRAAKVQSPCKGCMVTLNGIIVSWRLWDGGFYGNILRDGYTSAQPIDAAFWPLYPLLAKPLELVLGADRWQVSLLIVSNLATLAALVLLGALALQEGATMREARRAMALLVAAPLALFLIAAYSDSLFLTFALATLLCARRGQWRAGALWAFLAALTRPLGIILIAPLLYEFGRQVVQQTGVWVNWRAMRGSRMIWWRIWPQTLIRTQGRIGLLVLGAVPAAVALYSLVCVRVYGDPLAWLHAETLFNHVAMAPWSALGYAWRQFAGLTPGSFQQARVLVDDVPLLVVLVATLATIRRMPFSFTLLLVGLLLVCTTSPIVGALFPHAFVSVGRYLLAAIPLYLAAARLATRYPWLEMALIGGGFAVQALLMAFVLDGGWLV